MFDERKTVAKQHVKLYHKRTLLNIMLPFKDGFGRLFLFLCV